MKKFHSIIAFVSIFILMSNMVIVAQSTLTISSETNNKENYAKNRLIIKFNESTPKATKEKILKENKVNSSHQYKNGAQLVYNKGNQSLEKLKYSLSHNKHIAYAEYDYIVYADSTIAEETIDPTSNIDYSKLWGLNNPNDVDIDGPEAWNLVSDSAQVIVAVVDTGVQITHPDLQDNIWMNTGEFVYDNNGNLLIDENGNPYCDGIDNDGNGYIDDIFGWDFISHDNSVYDSIDDDHGTHVAGTIAGVDNNIGVIGVAPHASIMSLKFLGDGGGYISQAMEAIDYASAMGADVINASWGGTTTINPNSLSLTDSLTTLKESINQFPGVFVASAGNNSVNTDTSYHFPSGYDCDNIISVAAIDSSGALAYYSSYGLETVDIGAPGSSILSTIPYNAYAYYGGTSMASPHVTGTIALLLGQENNLSSNEVIQRVLSTSVPLPSLKGKTATGGLLNAYNTLTNTEAGHSPSLVSIIPNNESFDIDVSQDIIITFDLPIEESDIFSYSVWYDYDYLEETTYSIDGNTLTISPANSSNSWQYNRIYTVNVPAGSLRSTSGDLFYESIYSTFTTAIDADDVTGPTLIYSTIEDQSENVSINPQIYLEFDENIFVEDSSLITFMDTNGYEVASEISVSMPYLDIILNSALNYNTTYNLFVPEGAVTDALGNPNENDITISFTTEADPDIDTTPPKVLSIYTAGTTNVSINPSVMMIYFDETITLVDSSKITITDSEGTAIQKTLTPNTSSITVDITDTLEYSSEYTITVLPGCVLNDTGLPLEETKTSMFTTMDDIYGPKIISSSPVDGTDNISVTTDISITFDEDITIVNPTDVYMKTTTGESVEATFETSGSIMTVTYPDKLIYDKGYYIFMAMNSIEDEVGNGLGTNYSISFTTEESIFPTIKDVTPNNGATSVDIDTVVRVSFSEGIAIAGDSKISLKDSNSNTVGTSITIVEGSSGTLDTLILTPSDLLNNGTTYTVTLQPGAVEGLTSGNLNEVSLSSDFTTLNETMTTPLEVIYAPSSKVSLTPPIEVVFNQDISFLDASGISLSDIDIKANIDANDSKKLILAFDGKLSRLTNYTITIPAGSLEGQTDKFIFRFKTGPK